MQAVFITALVDLCRAMGSTDPFLRSVSLTASMSPLDHSPRGSGFEAAIFEIFDPTSTTCLGSWLLLAEASGMCKFRNLLSKTPRPCLQTRSCWLSEVVKLSTPVVTHGNFAGHLLRNRSSALTSSPQIAKLLKLATNGYTRLLWNNVPRPMLGRTRPPVWAIPILQGHPLLIIPILHFATARPTLRRQPY